MAVVEGAADERFLYRLFSGESLMVFQGGTRKNVLSAASDLVSFGLPRVVCIADRDFDDEVSKAEAAGLPLLPYEMADLEGMLWDSRVLSELLSEIGSTSKLRVLGGIRAFRDLVRHSLRPVERLRRANAVESWGVNFEPLRLTRRLQTADLSLNVRSLCDSLWKADLDISKADMFDAAMEYEEPRCPVTGKRLIHGKDAVAATAVALRRIVANLGYQEANPDRLGESLRLAAAGRLLRSSSWLEAVMAQLELSL